MKTETAPLRLVGRSLKPGLILGALAALSSALLAAALAPVNVAYRQNGLQQQPVPAASGFSDFLELEALDHLFGAATYTAPATVYLAFFSAAPSDAGGGTELTGNNYARVAITNNATNFPAASGGTKANGVAFQSPVFSGTTPTVVAWGLFDASSSGNLLVWGDLAGGDQKAYAANDRIEVAIGAMTISLT